MRISRSILVPPAVTAFVAAAALSASAGVGPVAGTTLLPAAQTTTAAFTGTNRVTGAPTAAVTDQAPSSAAGSSSRVDLTFRWPLSPRPVVHRRFDQPRDQWSPGHRGVDLVAAVGQPVLSAGNGVVAFSGVIAGRGVITIRHPGGLRTTYQPVEGRLRPGTLVHRGSRIGVISATAGHCVPLTCLHWGAISGRTYRDPLSLLGAGRPILLPLG
jgi:murein DD-endopeptidase MepM/ murein hydrolase activator NlpD